MGIDSFEGSDTITNYMVIGKIPGYNKNILSGDIKYDQRLKANLTTVRIRPTGYFLNIKNIGDSFFDTIGTGSLKKLDALFSIGKEVSLGGDINSPTNALAMWKKLLSSNFTGDEKNLEELRILATNDSTVTEVFSSEFGPSAIEKLSTSASNKATFQSLKNLKQATTIDSSYGLSLLENGTDNSLLNTIGGKVLGIQSAFPEEWVKSNYDNTLQLMIKLVSPSGDEASIKKYITDPLKMLMLAAAPVSYDGFNFGYPTLFEVEADGLMQMKLAGITAMTISRGGNETQFNRYNQPLNIDVRLTIRPLLNAFASAISDKPESNDESFNDAKTTYDKFVMTGPHDIERSMEKKDSTNLYYTEINL